MADGVLDRDDCGLLPGRLAQQRGVRLGAVAVGAGFGPLGGLAGGTSRGGSGPGVAEATRRADRGTCRRQDRRADRRRRQHLTRPTIVERGLLGSSLSTRTVRWLPVRPTPNEAATRRGVPT